MLGSDDDILGKFKELFKCYRHTCSDFGFSVSIGSFLKQLNDTVIFYFLVRFESVLFLFKKFYFLLFSDLSPRNVLVLYCHSILYGTSSQKATDTETKTEIAVSVPPKFEEFLQFPQDIIIRS